jgi:hypothetical protein
MGVLSALPIIYVGNLCCCMWVIAGGLVAAYVFQENHPEPMTVGDGALAGLLAGLVGAGVHFVLSIPIDIVMAPLERTFAQRLIDMVGAMPPEMREMIDRIQQQQMERGIVFVLVRRIAGFMIMLFIGAVFSTIGGVIGAAVFQKKIPPGTIDVTPSPPPTP